MGWKWDTGLGSARLVDTETGVPILTAIPGICDTIPTVAVNSGEWEGPPYRLAEVKGDERIARLLAAAPALLAACQLWDLGFEEGEDWGHERFLKWVNDNRRAARAAIAKALPTVPEVKTDG